MYPDYTQLYLLFAPDKPSVLDKVSHCITQLLVQALVISCIDYCNALRVRQCVVKMLLMVQNVAIFNQLKQAHITPVLVKLHWLPVAARLSHLCCWICSLLLEQSCLSPFYLSHFAHERHLAMLSVQPRQPRLFSCLVP